MAERRRFTRISRSLVTYYRQLDEGVPERAALAVDVSRGGLLVELDPAPPVGELLSMEIVLGSGRPPVNIVGRVVRTGDQGSGIEFVNIEPGDLERIQQFIAERRTGSGD